MNKEQYDEYITRRTAFMSQPLSEFSINQEKRYVHPFNIYGNIWYVGDSWVCVHLIDTGDGLLLIDSGNCGASAMLVQAIWEAGFNPADVKWIVHSHGHVDHIGASLFFQRMFHTKLYLSDADSEMFRTRPEFSYIQGAHNDCDTIFVPDVEIHDGDVIEFGSLRIRFVMVPGHTLGTLAMFFDMDGPDGMKHIGYFGGYGFNTMTRAELIEFGDVKLARRKMFLDSIKKVIDEPVDIMLANHTENGRISVLDKAALKERESSNPFIDPAEWKAYLSQKHQQMINYMNDPINN